MCKYVSVHLKKKKKEEENRVIEGCKRKKESIRNVNMFGSE